MKGRFISSDISPVSRSVANHVKGVIQEKPAAIQRDIDRIAPVYSPVAVAQLKPAVSTASAVIQRYPKLDGSKRKDALIYVIYKNNGKSIQSQIRYVGQTMARREYQRFYEHVTGDKWAPWYIHATKKGLDYSGDMADWPYRYGVVEDLKDVTKFETTVAEQWWMEHYLKRGLPLLNDSTPCTLSNFKKRSRHKKLYNPKNISVPTSYKPTMKAKYA
jgi:hypothetical protein